MAQVPNVSVNFDGDGVTAIFDFDFPYQKQSEVFVSVDGVNVTYTWLTGNTHSVQVLPAPALGTRVRIYRSTLAFVPLHVFAAGVPFLPRYVDENNRQMLYVAQESVNTSTAAMDIANEVRDRIDAAEDVAAEAIATANSAAGVAADAATVAGQSAVDAAEALGVANGIADTANEALETANAADAKADEALEAVSEAGVASWNGRTAIVVPESGDYNATQITYGAGNVADSKWDSVASDNTPGATPLVNISALAATIRSITAGTGVKFTVTAGNILLESETSWGRITGALSAQTDVQAALDSKLASALVDFAYAYPNGGSQASPANISANQRYTVANPFPGKPVICMVELLLAGNWADPGWATFPSNSNYGAKAGQLTNASDSTDIIIVKTGTSAVFLVGESGSPHNTSNPAGNPLPARVKVWRLKG